MTNTTVNNGQTVNNLDITSGNFVDVMAGGTANNTTIENGGTLAIEATSGGLLGGLFGPKTGGVANGVTVNNGGTLDLRGSNANASNIVLSGSFLEIDGAASVTGSLTFGPTTGKESDAVNLDGTSKNSGFKPTLVGFSASSDISDNAIKFSGATLTTTLSNGNTIATLSGNGVSDTFTFAGTEQLMIVADNGNDNTPNAVIVTTDTTLNFSAPFPAPQGSQTSTTGAHQPSTPAHGDSVSALQAGHASQPAMSFLSQSHVAVPAGSSALNLGLGAAAHGQAATAAVMGTQPLNSIAHEMALPQNQGLASAVLGTLSQPQIHRVNSGVTGFLPSQTTGGSAGALLSMPQHVATVAVTHTPLHIG